jgi:uncharacterized protein GlcG (DUF336 family)
MSAITLALANKIIKGGFTLARELQLKPLTVGVTGDLSDNDELCALAGLGAAGLVAQA